MQLRVKVVLYAQEDKVIEGHTEQGVRCLRVRINAVPENGKANTLLLRVLADYFQLPLQAISIIRGHKSTQKIVFVKDKA